MQQVWIKNAKHILVVLKGVEKDVIIFISQKTSYIRFSLLFGLYRKARAFQRLRNIAKHDFKMFLIMLQTANITLQGFIGKIEGDILFEMFFDVFVKEALIVEIRNIKKRFLRDFLILFDRLEISNGYSYTLQGVL